VSVTKHSAQTAGAQRKGYKLIHCYTPLIGLEAWLNMMGKMQMSSALTFVCWHIHRSTHPPFTIVHWPELSAAARWYRAILCSSQLFSAFLSW